MKIRIASYIVTVFAACNLFAAEITLPAYSIFASDKVSLMQATTSGDVIKQIPVVRRLNECDATVTVKDSDKFNYIYREDGKESHFSKFNPEMQDENPQWILRVGAGRKINTLAMASKKAKDGDVIILDSGVYVDQPVVWRQNDLTIIGDGNVIIKGTKVIGYKSGDDSQNGKALWVTRGNLTRIINVTFKGAKVKDKNGAGIRHEGKRLWLCKTQFYDNENGILSAGDLFVEHSVFANNGIGTQGKTHSIYQTAGDMLHVYASKFTAVDYGHHIKSRAKNTRVEYSQIEDGIVGKSSYLVDASNGGHMYLRGNYLQQGTETDNYAVLNFGTEGLKYQDNQIELIHNTVINSRHSGNLLQYKGTPDIRGYNNALFGKMTILPSLAAEKRGNFVSEALTDITIARNKAAWIGDALAPKYQIDIPGKLVKRQQIENVPDAGYKEFPAETP